jgi:chitin synthase
MFWSFCTVRVACPEGFDEFFNQRRRWMPSTIANIFDVLMDYKRVTKINEDISMLYVLYQVKIYFTCF